MRRQVSMDGGAGRGEEGWGREGRAGWEAVRQLHNAYGDNTPRDVTARRMITTTGIST